ncbi:MFS transporter [Paenarthrobacter sp. NPDC089714]|uniref:MFS transporter n=1 Tax=Paenarthrobacter sp. NPDC089714 TaxID=3364377 RepID=UPI0037F3207E
MSDASRRSPWMSVAPSVFVLAWGGNHFTPLLHMYETLGGYDAWQANLLLGMYVVGLIPGLLLAAALADRLGRKPVALVGIGAAAAASLLLAFGMTSFILLCVGRTLAGVGVGVGMSVGSSWIKELSDRSREPSTQQTSGARRSSMTLTLGFGVGAGITGALAQWAPAPGQLPYLVHLALCVMAFVALLRAPESLPLAARAVGPLWRDLVVPSAGHRTFWGVVVPAAPWVFAAAGVAYAIMPAVVQSRLGDFSTLYATVLTVVTLGVGVLAQTTVVFLNRITRGRALIVGLAGMSIGMGSAVVASAVGSPWLAIIVAVILGASYGVCVVSGLIVAQSIATPRDLAGMTGIYYSLTYLGFLLPTLLAASLTVISYTIGLGLVVVACVASLIRVMTSLRTPGSKAA